MEKELPKERDPMGERPKEWDSASRDPLFQERYDYRSEGDILGDIARKLDLMDQKGLGLVCAEVDRILARSAQEQQEECEGWFAHALLPTLKSIAESSNATLELMTEKGGGLSATLQSKDNYDILLDNYRIKALFLTASYLSIEKTADGTALVLTFDYDDLKH